MKPTPHLEKLTATLANDKLPATDRPRIEAAKARYRDWIDAMSKVQGPSDVALSALVPLLDEYKRYIDLNLIFDSPEDFLYRQKGQLKLDNSIIEEFLPWLLASNTIAQTRSYEVPSFSQQRQVEELSNRR